MNSMPGWCRREVVVMKVSIGFSTSDWWVSRVIRFFTRAPVSHTYIVFDDTLSGFDHEVYEAAWCGFRMSTREKLESGTTRIVKEVAVDLNAAKALAICRGWLECPYDYAGLVGEAWVMLGRLFRKRWNNPFAGPHHMFCSEAATFLLQMAGGDPALKARAMSLVPRATDPYMLELVLTAGAGKCPPQ
jgi:hypothetical protein